jgi:type I restriction enzyme S subunit
VRLGELAEFRNGVNYNKSNFGEGIKVINVGDFQDRIVPDLDRLDEIDPHGVVRADHLLQPNDILFVRSNGNRLLIGRSMVVPEGAGRVTHSAFTIRLRFTAPNVEPRFFVYLFRSNAIRDVLSAQGGGTNISNLNQEILSSMRVPVPSVPEQRHIASTLSAYDDLIENNTRRIAVLEEMARALYREWFVEFRFPGHEKARMAKTRGKQFPEGWTYPPLGKLVHELRDTVDPKSIEAATPYVGLEHLPRRSTTLVDWGFSGDVESTKLRFCLGDILFGKIRPYFHKVAVAPFDGVSSSDAIVMRLIDADLHGLVLGCVSSDEFVAHATQTSNGTKMPRANWSVLKEYPVPMPPAPILARFDRLVRDAIAEAQLLAAKNRNLRTTRDLLLPRLISGEIDLMINPSSVA